MCVSSMVSSRKSFFVLLLIVFVLLLLSLTSSGWNVRTTEHHGGHKVHGRALTPTSQDQSSVCYTRDGLWQTCSCSPPHTSTCCLDLNAASCAAGMPLCKPRLLSEVEGNPYYVHHNQCPYSCALNELVCYKNHYTDPFHETARVLLTAAVILLGLAIFITICLFITDCELGLGILFLVFLSWLLSVVGGLLFSSTFWDLWSFSSASAPGIAFFLNLGANIIGAIIWVGLACKLEDRLNACLQWCACKKKEQCKPAPPTKHYESQPHHDSYPAQPHHDSYPAQPHHDSYPAQPHHDSYPAQPHHDSYPAQPHHDSYPAQPHHDSYPAQPHHGSYPSSPRHEGHPSSPRHEAYHQPVSVHSVEAHLHDSQHTTGKIPQ